MKNMLFIMIHKKIELELSIMNKISTFLILNLILIFGKEEYLF